MDTGTLQISHSAAELMFVNYLKRAVQTLCIIKRGVEKELLKLVSILRALLVISLAPAVILAFTHLKH